jgi:hypothetical protein
VPISGLLVQSAFLPARSGLRAFHHRQILT